MCFAPWISLSTFIIEILLAIWVFIKGPKKLINQLGAVILILLGLYQLTEFMICLSLHPLFWGKMAHLTYTFLPALGVHWAFALVKEKKRLFYVYILPIIFSALVLSSPLFVKSAECSRYFITVLFEWNPIWLWCYGLYYGGFILVSAIILMKAIISENNKSKRKIYSWGFIGLLSFTVPTLIFILFFPMMNIMFPSVLCEFALLFGISVVYTAYLSEKSRRS